MLQDDVRVIRTTSDTLTSATNTDPSTITCSLREEYEMEEPKQYADNYLRINDSQDWLYLGSYKPGYFTESFVGLEMSWIIPQRLMQAEWHTSSHGVHSTTVTAHRIFVLSQGNTMQHVYLVEAEEHYEQANQTESLDKDIKINWDEKSKRLTCKSTGEFRSHDKNGDNPHSSTYPTQVNDYQLTENGLELSAKYTLVHESKGFPTVHEAESYGSTLAEFLNWNPHLRGKVFCDGPVYVQVSGKPTLPKIKALPQKK